MSYLNRNLDSFLADISKGSMGTPFGGSVVVLSILTSVQLFCFVLNYTLTKGSDSILNVKNYLSFLKDKKNVLQSHLDNDILIVESIINAYKTKDSEIIKNNLKIATESSLFIFESIIDIGEMIEKSAFDIKKSVLSDLAIVNESHYSNLLSLQVNIFINLLYLKNNDPENKYAKWAESIEKDIYYKLDLAYEKKKRITQSINSRLSSNFYIN